MVQYLKAACLIALVSLVAFGQALAVDYTQDANCVGAWYMSAAAGASEIDRSPSGSNLTDNSTTAVSTNVPTGYVGKSKYFNGATQYLKRADGGALDINGANAKISIVAWVYVITAPANGAYDGIVSKYATVGDLRQYFSGTGGTGSGKFLFEFSLSSDGTSAAEHYVDSTVTTYSPNTWYHVAFVSNDVDLRIYVNGVLASVPAAHTAGIYNSSAQFEIGTFIAGYGPFKGYIDEVAVLNRDLSAIEVSDIYTNGITGNKGASDRKKICDDFFEDDCFWK